MFKTIVVAVDGGDLTGTITDYALRLAGNANVYFVCAVDPERLFSDAAAGVFNSVGDRQAAIDAAQTIVDRCVTLAKEASVRVSGRVIEDAPAEAILKTAELTGADLIVMASHGRNGLRRAILGSVAESVARRAPVAVLFVPALLPADEPSRHLHHLLHGT